MDFVTSQTYLADILHDVSQALLVPDIVLLLLMVLYGLFCIGSILAETFTERRNFRVAMPVFLAALTNAEERELPATITSSGLLNRQKIALLTVFDYRMLPGDALIALIRRLVANEERHYARIAGRNDLVAKLAPMFGLMGTLIPLGPGVAALGTGNVEQLASSIVVAFDTTVAGLAVAVVCLIVGKIRRGWYEDYMTALDAAMATMLEKIQDMSAADGISADEPTDEAGRFARSVKGGAAVAKQSKDAAFESLPGQASATGEA